MLSFRDFFRESVWGKVKRGTFHISTKTASELQSLVSKVYKLQYIRHFCSFMAYMFKGDKPVDTVDKGQSAQEDFCTQVLEYSE